MTCNEEEIRPTVMGASVVCVPAGHMAAACIGCEALDRKSEMLDRKSELNDAFPSPQDVHFSPDPSSCGLRSESVLCRSCGMVHEDSSVVPDAVSASTVSPDGLPRISDGAA